MKKSTRIWLIVAVCLIIAGVAIMAGGLSFGGFDLEKMTTQEIETVTYESDETVTDILVNTITADVAFVPSEDENVIVVYQNEEKLKHSVQVEGSTLVIEAQDTRKWMDYIGINFHTPAVTIYLPAGEYDDLQIHTDTGHVTMPADFSFQNAQLELSTGKTLWRAHVVRELDIQCSTGNVTLEDTSCGSLHVQATTGDVTLTRTSSLGTLEVKTNTGDVKLEKVDGGEIDIETTTGNVTGTLCTDKVFNTKTATGKITTPSGKELVPGQKPSNKCTVSTDTGDIHLEIAN